MSHQHRSKPGTVLVHRSKSLQTKGVPLPEVDEQLLPLQQQVRLLYV
jgi:hypothetical protein